MKKVFYTIFLFLPLWCFCQKPTSTYTQLNRAYKQNDTVMLGRYISQWHDNIKIPQDPRRQAEPIKTLYQIVEDILSDTTSEVRHFLDRQPQQYLILPSQIEFGETEIIDPWVLMLARLPDSVKAGYLKSWRSSRNSFEIALENIYEIPEAKTDTVKNFYPEAPGKYLYLTDSLSSELRALTESRLIDSTARLIFINSFRYLTDTISPDLKRYLRSKVPDRMERREFLNSYIDLYHWRNADKLFDPNHSRYIKKVVVDRRHEWAIVYYNVPCKCKVLFKKTNDRWQLYEVISSIVF